MFLYHHIFTRTKGSIVCTNSRIRSRIYDGFRYPSSKIIRKIINLQICNSLCICLKICFPIRYISKISAWFIRISYHLIISRTSFLSGCYLSYFKDIDDISDIDKASHSEISFHLIKIYKWISSWISFESKNTFIYNGETSICVCNRISGIVLDTNRDAYRVLWFIYFFVGTQRDS